MADPKQFFVIDRNNPLPAYIQLKDILLKQIKDGAMKPGDRMLSETQLCRIYGISRGTAIKAIGELIREGFIYREQGRGTFVKEMEMNALSIGIIIDDYRTVEDFNFGHILRGIGEGFRDRSARLTLVHSAEYEKRKNDHNGFIALALRMDSSALKDIEETWSNSVLLSCRSGYWPDKVSCVDADNMESSFKAVEHLVKLGHKRIGIINADMSHIHAVERLNSYKMVMEKHNISFNEDLVSYVKFLPKDVWIETKRLMALTPAPTAIFCVSDRIAAAAVRTLQASDIQVPDEVAVSGYNDDVSVAMSVEPMLTTVRQPLVDMGRASAEMITDIIDGKQQEPKRRIFPAELVIRDSCGYRKKNRE